MWGGPPDAAPYPAPVLSGEKPASGAAQPPILARSGAVPLAAGAGRWTLIAGDSSPEGDPCRWHPCQALFLRPHTPAHPRGVRKGCVVSLFSGACSGPHLCS